MPVRQETLYLITYGRGEKFCPEKFEAVTNKTFIKPSGGLWASPVDSKFGWADWCRQESFGDLTSSFEFSYTGNILIIDTVTDLEDMLWFKPEPLHWIEIPDFEAIRETGIDAIWLTESGQWATRLSDPRNLYGWDCESVLILNPKGINC